VCVPLHLCVLKGLKCVLPHAMLESVEERGREQFEVVFYTLRHFDRASAHSVEWVVRSGVLFLKFHTCDGGRERET